MAIRFLSRPSRGAWIEMMQYAKDKIKYQGRAPRGARGLKYARILAVLLHTHVAPLAGRVD